jgi:hypothetical protein
MDEHTHERRGIVAAAIEPRVCQQEAEVSKVARP